MYRAKPIYMRCQGDMLCELKTNNPKRFYKLFHKKKAELPSDLKLCDFHEHFGSLAVRCDNEPADHIFDNECMFEELDLNFTNDELVQCIKCLKRGNLLELMMF